MASGLAVGAVGWWLARHQWQIAFPDLTSVPEVSGVALLGILAGLGAAVCAPPPRLTPAATPRLTPAPPAPAPLTHAEVAR